jgi:hypothetical protein
MTGDTVDITTETSIPKNQKDKIRQRVQMVIDLGILPILKHIKFYSLND